MDTRKKVGKEAVRTALQALGEGGKEISYRLVYEALGLESEAEQAVVRSRISDMTRHGEVKRTRTGCVIYDFKHRPREGKSYGTLWRFVRKAKSGWTISDCALMTRISYTQAMRYCNWLEEEGFVETLAGCFHEGQTDEELVATVNAAFGTSFAAADFTNALSAAAGNRPVRAGTGGCRHHRAAHALRGPLREKDGTKHHGSLPGSSGPF